MLDKKKKKPWLFTLPAKQKNKSSKHNKETREERKGGKKANDADADEKTDPAAQDDTDGENIDAEEVNNQSRPSTSAKTPEEKYGTPALEKEAGGLAPAFRMPDGTTIPPEEDEFSAKRWGLTAEQLALPYAKEAADLEDILMEGVETAV